VVPLRGCIQVTKQCRLIIAMKVIMVQGVMMKVNLIVRLEPESKQEALEYAKHYAMVKENFNNLTTQWGIPPAHFLLKTKRFE
jgi:hypothetical protein